MTCQHCQTWILDGEHRCGRCNRRVRATPSRISPATYPIAATATAPAYDFEVAAEAPAAPDIPIGEPVESQQRLFNVPEPRSRVIPFATLTSPGEREAIRLRAAETQRPTPVQNTRVSAKRARTKRSDSEQHVLADQGRLEFEVHQEVAPALGSHMPADALVATASMRMHAALLDSLLIAAGSLLGASPFLFAGRAVSLDKHTLPFLAAALLTVPLFYKLLWAFAGLDSPGTRMAGLELVDFDGKTPSRERRYSRLFGGMISFLAAGVGLIWALVDEDKLTWHDHISGTFPTFAGEN